MFENIKNSLFTKIYFTVFVFSLNLWHSQLASLFITIFVKVIRNCAVFLLQNILLKLTVNFLLIYFFILFNLLCNFLAFLDIIDFRFSPMPVEVPTQHYSKRFAGSPRPRYKHLCYSIIIYPVEHCFSDICWSKQYSILFNSCYSESILIKNLTLKYRTFRI